jgi:hypothetical protein
MSLFKRVLAAAAGLAVCSQIVNAALPPDQVPTFLWRARVLTSGGKPAGSNSVFSVSINQAGLSATGQAWSAWYHLDREQAKVAVGPANYPNNYSTGWPIVFRLSFPGLVNPADVEAEVKFDGESGKPAALAGTLAGGDLGFLVYRENGKPRAVTMRDYNRRYWKAFEKIPLSPAERPALFPICDRFIPGDSDLNGLAEGIGSLAKGGFSAILVEPEKPLRAALLKNGLSKIAWAVYSPPGYAFDYTVKGQAEIDAFAAGIAASYTNAGFARTDMALFCLSDEPGWYYPETFRTLTNNPAGLGRFREYLESQGLKPKDVGAGRWEEVLPLGRSHARDLPSKRLFYWSMRFFPWDSARHFARTTRALEQAFYTNMPVLVNWNFFAGRCYVPGPVAGNAAATDPDAGMGGHDWLEFARMRGCTMLWTEDWFGDQQAYQWSFYAARLRAGARLGGIRFGGYVIPRTAGDREDGILQKVLTLIGSGGKGLKYFVFGPEYNFPGNCYSENVQVLPKMAEAHRMIAKAESLLWPGERPVSPVGLLMPRSAQMWDAKSEKIPTVISDATNTDMNRGTVDYMAELFDLYLALQHENIPAEMVDEDDLTEKGLAGFKVLYVTEPDIPVEGQEALVNWVKAGGTLVTVCGAGLADRYDESADVLARGLGYEETAPARLIVENTRSLSRVAGGTGTNGAFFACGARSKLTIVKGTTVAVFDDGTPALVRNELGQGRSFHFAWFPGLSYWHDQKGTADGLPVGWSMTLRRMITDPVREAGVTPPVRVDTPMIETPSLVSEAGMAVTLLNWSGARVEKLCVSVVMPGKASSVESVKQGKVPFEKVEGGIQLTMPLGSADVLMIRR